MTEASSHKHMVCRMFRNRLLKGVVKVVGRRAASTESVGGEWAERLKEEVHVLKGRSASVP